MQFACSQVSVIPGGPGVGGFTPETPMVSLKERVLRTFWH